MKNNNAMVTYWMEYAKRIAQALADGELDIDDCAPMCEFCPLRDKCRESAENGDEMTCAQFINKIGGAC